MGFSHFVNPLSCAVGHAVLQEILECDLTDNAADRGEELKELLEARKAQCEYIGEVRSKGLLLALELVVGPETKTPFKRELDAAVYFKIWQLRTAL